MTETTMQVLHTINAVDGFNPAEFTRNLPNEDGRHQPLSGCEVSAPLVPASPAAGEDFFGNRL